MRRLTLLAILFTACSAIPAQASRVLFDDLNSGHPQETFHRLIDTLRSAGAIVDSTDATPFATINPAGYDLFICTFGGRRWGSSPASRDYTDADRGNIIRACFSGTNVLVVANDARGNAYLNQLLSDSRWITGIGISDDGIDCMTRRIDRVPGVTDGVDSLVFWGAANLRCEIGRAHV